MTLKEQVSSLNQAINGNGRDGLKVQVARVQQDVESLKTSAKRQPLHTWAVGFVLAGIQVLKTLGWI